MKKQFALSSFLALVAGSAIAQTSADLPRLYPDCMAKNTLVMPNGVEGTAYFWNPSCSIAYIVPPPTASMEVSDPAPSMNLQLCPAISSSNKSIVSIYEQIAQLDEASTKLSIDDPKRQTYNDMAEKLQARLAEVEKLGNGLQGLTVQMNLKGSLTPEYLNALNLANLPSIEKGLKIRQAPLEKSYLSFNAVIPGSEKTFLGNPVLYSNVEGILSKADENRDDRTSIRFNGAASGGIALNLNGACAIMEGDFSAPQSLKLNKEKVGTYLNATQTMMVPLLTSFGYSASLDVQSLTDVLFTKLGHKSQFTAEEFSRLALSGDAKQAFTFTSWTYEDLTGNLQTIYEKDLSTDQRTVIKASLLDQYMKALVDAKFIKEITPLDTPNAGMATETGTRQECWSDSIFGIRVGGGCSNVTYQYQVPHDGNSDQNASIANEIKGHLQDTVEIWRPTNRVFTSAFKVQ